MVASSALAKILLTCSILDRENQLNLIANIPIRISVRSHQREAMPTILSSSSIVPSTLKGCRPEYGGRDNQKSQIKFANH
jgi:hypothetical protein